MLSVLASVERPYLDLHTSVWLKALNQLSPWLLHVALDQGLLAAFANGVDQFGRYALADQIGLDGLCSLLGHLRVALRVAQLVGVTGNDDLADVGRA